MEFILKTLTKLSKMKKNDFIIVFLLLFSLQSFSQVRYYFRNTSNVNQLQFGDDEIYLNFQLHFNGFATTLDDNFNQVLV